MARPSEKARSVLNRYVAQKRNEELGIKRPQRRPHLAALESDVKQAEYWRQQIIREISEKVMEIQKTDLGEEKTRDLNDSINKLMREKRHWERQIHSLGGRDYSVEENMRKARNAIELGADKEDQRPIEHKGFFYFGAAKNLPGVRELFQRGGHGHGHGAIDGQRGRSLWEAVNCEYFGFEEEQVMEKYANIWEQHVEKDSETHQSDPASDSSAVVSSVRPSLHPWNDLCEELMAQSNARQAETLQQWKKRRAEIGREKAAKQSRGVLGDSELQKFEDMESKRAEQMIENARQRRKLYIDTVAKERNGEISAAAATAGDINGVVMDESVSVDVSLSVEEVQKRYLEKRKQELMELYQRELKAKESEKTHAK